MKSSNLKVRVEQKWKEKIDKFCLKNNIKVSDYLRSLIKQSSKKTIRITTNKEKLILYNLTYELQKVGTNINQIAHYFNLKHLKNLDKKAADLNKNSTKKEDLSNLILIDKLQKKQLEDIKNTLNSLTEIIEIITNNLEQNYGK